MPSRTVAARSCRSSRRWLESLPCRVRSPPRKRPRPPRTSRGSTDFEAGTSRSTTTAGSIWRTPLPPLRYPRNFLNSVRDSARLEFPEVNTAVGISAPAFPMNASDRIWQEYGLGERYKIIDPTTKKPAVRNVFLDGGEFSVKALQARGTVFWQCQYALDFVAGQLAQSTGRPVAQVRADLIAGLNPGVRLVPSHMMALGAAQERGFTYVRV